MKKGLSAILQPTVDVLVAVDHAFLSSHNLKPGSYALVDSATQEKLIAATPAPQKISSGGCVSNSIACATLLGVPCRYNGLVADDPFGKLYRDELTALGIASPNTPILNARTGTCLSLITPDGERTMQTHLGAALELDHSHIDIESIRSSSWLLLEGHLLTAGAKNVSALFRGIEIANQVNTHVALNVCSELAARSKRQEILTQILPKIDLIIANAPEAMAFSDHTSPQAAFAAMAPLCKTVVVTCGKDGALVKQGDKHIQISAHTDITTVDSTGAGDAFLGALVGGLSLGLSIETAGRGAARLAAAVVSQEGARLPATAANLWREATK